MDTLRKLLNSASWQEVLAVTDVWWPRLVLFALLCLVGGVATQTPTAATYVQAGLAAQSQQEYWRAESFFQQAELSAPNDYQPALDLARLHLLEHQDGLAQSEAATALSLQANDADIWLTLGDIAHNQGNQPDAEHDWIQAARLNPAATQLQAHERLGMLYEEQSRWQAAAAQFAALPGSNTLAQYHLGALRLELGDRAGARQAFEATRNETTSSAMFEAASQFLQAISQWDGSAQSLDLVGLTYIQIHLPGFAALPLKQAISLAPQDATAYGYLSWVYLSLGANTRAQQEAQTAVNMDHTNSYGNYVLSQLDIANGNYDDANTALETALLSDPQDPTIWAGFASISEALNDPISAEHSLQQAVQDADGDPQYSVLLATFYANYQLGLNDGTALNAARAALGLDPTNGAAYDALGRIQQERKDFPDAMNAFLQAVNLAPTNAVYHVQLGSIEAILGYLRSAELNLHKAIVLDLHSSIANQAQQILQTLPSLSV